MAGKGGVIPGQGRKSKAEELGVVARIEKYIPGDDLIKELSSIFKSKTTPKALKVEIAKLLLAYLYGKPKEHVDLSGDVSFILPESTWKPRKD